MRKPYNINQGIILFAQNDSSLFSKRTKKHMFYFEEGFGILRAITYQWMTNISFNFLISKKKRGFFVEMERAEWNPFGNETLKLDLLWIYDVLGSLVREAT
jgi:hypothetical protein